jgi:hypothetical protein
MSRAVSVEHWVMEFPNSTLCGSKGTLKKHSQSPREFMRRLCRILILFEIAKDKVDDALFKRHFPMLAPVVGWANTPIIPTLEAFVDSEDVATDYNELRLMNNAIQRQVNESLIPYLKSDWQDQLTKAVEQAAPQLKMP